MTLPFTSSDIKKHVDHDLSVCAALLSIMEQEQEALKTRDADKVDSLVEQKIPLLERLENSSKLRQTWANNANTPSTEEGWAALITELGDGDIKQNWATLKEQYRKIRTQNEINGKLLSKHQGTVKRMLDILRGNTATPNLYNASGYSSNGAQSNKFGEA